MNISFKKIDFTTMQEDARLFESQMNTVISPIYGDQTEMLRQCRLNNDRSCIIMYDDSNPVGILVYKNIPTNEYNQYGLMNSFELKTLFIINAHVNSGKGYGNLLLQHAFEAARQANAGSIHATVSENVNQSRIFFKKYGFIEVVPFPNKFQTGVIEYLISYSF